MHLADRPSTPPSKHMQISFRYLKNRKGGKGEPAARAPGQGGERQNCVKYVNVKKVLVLPSQKMTPRGER